MVKRGRLGSQLRGLSAGRWAEPGARAAPARGTAYPGDFMGTPEITYAPNPGNDHVADPGEIVWIFPIRLTAHGPGRSVGQG